MTLGEYVFDQLFAGYSAIAEQKHTLLMSNRYVPHICMRKGTLVYNTFGLYSAMNCHVVATVSLTKANSVHSSLLFF